MKNKKLKKRVRRLEAKYLQLKNIVLSKGDSSNLEHTEHLTQEQTEDLGNIIETEPVVKDNLTTETEGKEIEWERYLGENGNPQIMSFAVWKITKYANQEPVIKKL